MSHKITITRDYKAKKQPPKSNFLTANQKSELKKMLLDKFTKLYGYANPAAVQEDVKRFFDSNVPINSQAINELENQIKRNALKYKSNVISMPKKTEEIITQPAQEDHVNQPQSLTNDNGHQQSSINFKPSFETDQMEDQDGNDMDTLGAYQAYILKQEKELERKRRLLEQKAIKSQLDKQIEEKKQRDISLKEEHLSYVKIETMQQDQFKHQTQLAEHRKAEEKRHLLEMQQKMMVERQIQLTKDKQLSEELDQKIKECIEQDLVQQKKLQIANAEARRQEMARAREENELWKIKKKEQEEKERLEDIELHKLSDQLAEELENRRNSELKAKAEKIQQMMIAGEKVIYKQQERKKEEERQVEEYMAKKERALDRKEQRQKLREKECTEEYKKFLENQMQERQDKRKKEREFINEQAEIWASERLVYEKHKKEQEARNLVEKENFKNTLARQVKDNQEKIALKKTIEMPDEQLMRQKLLEQIKVLDSQNQLLSQKLTQY